MTRRPILGDAVNLAEAEAPPGEGRPQPAFHDRPPPAPAPSTTTSAHLKARAVATTIYFLPADHDRLHRLAIDRHVALQGLIMDALDQLLGQEGQPPLERWKPRRKPR